ncbi:cyclic nucleotide-binding domain-containing protein [Desulfobacter hydrogenophilus]|uniref:Cyclic nucleotide-binding domain-containing protein n=1 Tax=Desulfobacter hydrogenophilus TaxID=2291 RepID=A0A328F9T3_9BACT|nr:cyclic nucleotide-binding domain-containing protein [Desulfobacter hydrogenophilus]NDY73283.1 cyclic nucleotide-binding domain-containing protein [Desulfobacter hydrogenophilus]QBH15266.1 cyclic nucleotide-binding domain-containing protein [Desulfobacter hydrogenophilus]RAL99894.1 cyclic nucleotide-binding domain-containing protein [Desulfobacter hydrogenophilus]
MDSSAACLSESIIFKGLDTQEIESLVPFFSRRSVLPGELLACAGHYAQFFFLLEEGALLVSMDEGRAVVLNSRGDFAGFSMVSLSGTNTATITVLEKGAVWVVPCRNILDLTDPDTHVAATIMDGWQQFCREKAPFCSNLAETGVI